MVKSGIKQSFLKIGELLEQLQTLFVPVLMRSLLIAKQDITATRKKTKQSFKDVDKYLMKWFKCSRDVKIFISGEMLLLKGQELEKKIGYENKKT